METGKNKFSDIYESQIDFQSELMADLAETKTPPSGIEEVEGKLPCDSVDWFKYHCLAMSEEMGEVMQADKRWKTHRNERYVPEEKLDELADVFITFMNMCIYSGFSAKQVENAVRNKIEENRKRINNKVEE